MEPLSPNGYLTRTYYPGHTFGTLVIGGETFHTIERPWLDNQRNVSCVPAGSYRAIFLPRSASGKYRRVWHLKPVDDRTGILVHNGNLVRHTKGCLILGNSKGTLAGQPAVLSSKPAMRRLLNLIGQNEFNLEIIGEAHA